MIAGLIFTIRLALQQFNPDDIVSRDFWKKSPQRENDLYVFAGMRKLTELMERLLLYALLSWHKKIIYRLAIKFLRLLCFSFLTVGILSSYCCRFSQFLRMKSVFNEAKQYNLLKHWQKKIFSFKILSWKRNALNISCFFEIALWSKYVFYNCPCCF